MNDGTEIRTLTEGDVAGWMRAMQTGFMRPPSVTEADVELFLKTRDLSRTRGAYDGRRWVGTYRSFDQELTVPGGAAVSSCAVSAVTVSPTHRRRGLLSRMLREDMEAAKERGDVVASLIAAEYPIYGRYGFGPAAWTTDYDVTTPRAQLDPRYAGPDDGGTVELLDAAELTAIAPALHDRFRRLVPGAVNRSATRWQAHTGAARYSVDEPWHEPFYAAYGSAAGEPEGIVTYRTKWGDWPGKLSDDELTVTDLFAVTPAAERALWRYLVSFDWITTIHTGHRAPDDLLPLYLGDPRAARVTTHADYLWLRPLDVPRLLEARAYAASGSLVLDVHDPAGLAGGRFLLDAGGPGGTGCVPTDRPADLALSVAELARLSLGDESAVRLAALGVVDEERPGAAARADALLRTSRRPWCPDMF
ncbi:GNAT family N-acetyltransferase [Streptomyces sp. B22F1]|uniref:GNAT family N-acetyltransferase n=1 Tax=Streptomyces sp. B22F1 TaxID=3153566 RepID=UPI00325C9F3F